MVSALSIELISWIIKYGSLVKVFPGTWDPTNKLIKFQHGRRIHIPLFPSLFIYTGDIIPAIYLLLQILHVAYFVVFLQFFEHSVEDMCLATCIMMCLCLAISTEITFLLDFKNFCNIINAVVLEDRRLGKNANKFYFGNLNSLHGVILLDHHSSHFQASSKREGWIRIHAFRSLSCNYSWIRRRVPGSPLYIFQ